MANEVPEKIYLNPLLMEGGESIRRRCTLERQNDKQIEYTRTDAFIEKAVKYIQQHRMRKATMVEKFKKYMEEE